MKKIFGVIFVAIFAFIGFKTNVSAWDIDMEEVAETKKITIKSIKPTNDDLWGIIDEMMYFSTNGWTFDIPSCNEDVTVCNFSNWEIGTIEDVEVTWVYDEDVKKVVDKLMEKIPEDGITFTLTDIETLRYYVESAKFMDTHETIENPDDLINLATYSSELKEYLGYNNFKVEPRMGERTEYYEMQGGTATFIYDDTIYGVTTGIKVQAKNIFYVPEGTEDIEAYFKEKMSKYYADEMGIVGEFYIDFDDYVVDESIFFGSNYESSYEYLKNMYPTKESYVNYWLNYYFYDDDAPLGFLNDEENHFVVFNIDNHYFSFKIVEDDEMAALTDELITKDVKSNVQISTNSVVPLDTLIQVAKITTGDEYDRIVGILEQTDIEIFDLSLFSKTTGDFVTELADGTFEVTLPIKEDMQGKALVVYYFDADGNKVKYDVEISEDGKYATFRTNHFSTYTLAVDPNANTNNPLTYDSVIKYILIIMTSILALGSLVVIKKRFN